MKALATIATEAVGLLVAIAALYGWILIAWAITEGA